MTFIDPQARKTVMIAVIPFAIAVLLAGCETLDGPVSGKQATSEIVVKGIEDDQFLTLYPGVFTDRESALVEKYFSDNAALLKRGPIDAQALVAGDLPDDTPGLGPVINVSKEMVDYYQGRLDRENPIRFDKAYAQSLGFDDILAYPTFGAHDDTFMVPYPANARDKLLVSDLNHEVENHAPIYPGDTLYLVMDSREVIDITPQGGSTFRSVAINSKGSVYNQRAELVSDVTFRVTENIRIYSDPASAPENATFMDVWMAPDWKTRPARYYTDEDWAFIKDIWRKEERRGATPLYWEDVKIGDTPAWTLEGPIEESVSPVPPWGMGLGGSRTLKEEILDPETISGMIRGEQDGIYRLSNLADYIPSPPEWAYGDRKGPPPLGAIDTTQIHKKGAQRSPLVNYMGRDLAIRHLQNWMGDHGWIQKIGWSIMDPRGHADLGYPVPANPKSRRYLEKVPSLNGRYPTTHGLTQDIAIIKSYVHDKSIKGDKHFVDLIWWIETIDGDIWEEGGARIKLPSRSE